VGGGCGGNGGSDLKVLIQPLELQGGEGGSWSRCGDRNGSRRVGVGAMNVSAVVDSDGAREGEAIHHPMGDDEGHILCSVSMVALDVCCGWPPGGLRRWGVGHIVGGAPVSGGYGAGVRWGQGGLHRRGA